MKQWPPLEYDCWKHTYHTIHRWVQIVGKLRLTQAEVMNHSWHCTMYVTPTGLTTSPIPVRDGSVEVSFDFSEHCLRLVSSEGEKFELSLRQAEPVAEFYARFTQALGQLGIRPHFDEHPNELPDNLPFSEDTVHRTYNPEQVENFRQILVKADLLMKKFRSEFTGKASPVHFFWGGFDLAVTRFSGRRAPEHPGGVPHLPDLVAKEAYSHEVSSAGFWPGNEDYPHAAFYSYAYPEPPGFKDSLIQPEQAFYHDSLREFILPYDIVRATSDPEAMVLSFFRSTFDAAAELGRWSQEVLEPSPYFRGLCSNHASPGI